MIDVVKHRIIRRSTSMNCRGYISIRGIWQQEERSTLKQKNVQKSVEKEIEMQMISCMWSPLSKALTTTAQGGSTGQVTLQISGVGGMPEQVYITRGVDRLWSTGIVSMNSECIDEIAVTKETRVDDTRR